MSHQKLMEGLQKLPPVPKEVLGQIWDMCSKMGVSIDPKELEFVCRMFVAFIQGSSDGKKYLLKELINARVTRGDYLKQYFSRNGMGERQQELSHNSLVHFEGYVFEANNTSTFVNPVHVLELDEPNLIECDITHTKLPRDYCVKPARGTDGRNYNLSNYARMHSENQTIRSTGEQKTCTECRYLRCPFNPDRAQQIAQSATTPPPQIEHKPVFTSIRGLQ